MRTTIKILGLIFLLTWFATTGAAQGEHVGNFCPFGTCVIETPVLYNVYWDNSLAQWDIDVAASPSQMRSGRIDALTKALIHSGYFSDLRQYSVRAVRFSEPSIAAGNCAPPPATIDQAFDQVSDLADCLFRVNPLMNSDNTILNVFLPPQTTPSSATAEFCSVANGQHDSYGSSVAIAIIPTNAACNSSLNSMFRALTHEIVEAATDPHPSSPTGWKAPFWFGGGEIADFCPTATPFLFGQVSQFWSDRGGRCSNGFAQVFLAPWGFTTGVCGTGRATQIAVSGAEIGPRPWDLSSNVSQTMYLKAQISGIHSWEAGNAIGLPANGVNGGNPSPVFFQGISWEQTPGLHDENIIQINGFDSGYGAALSPGGNALFTPGDTITVSVASQHIGQFGSVAITAPTGSQVTHFAVQPVNRSMLIAGQQARITGNLEDVPQCSTGGPPSDCARTPLWNVPLGPRCIIEGSPVTFTSSAGSISNASPLTSASGAFSATYTAPLTSGMQTVGLQIPIVHTISIAVHPGVNSLAPRYSGTSGGATASIQGVGFVPGSTTVRVDAPIASPPSSVAATVASVTATGIQFTIPRSPLPGDGSGKACVTVISNGIESECLQLTYVVPGKPVLTFTWLGCDAGSLFTEALAVDGTPMHVQVRLTASYNAFRNAAGNWVASLTVTTPQSVDVMDSGPLTATNVASSALTVTQTFPSLSTQVCPGSNILRTGIDPRWQAFAEDLLKPVPLPPCSGPECVNPIAIWASSKDPLAGRPYAEGPRSAVDSPNGFEVRGIASALLQSYVLANPYAAVKGVDVKKQVSFTGAALSIGVVGHPASEIIKLKDHWQVSFPLAAGAGPASEFRIMHLTSLGKVTAWEEVADVRVDAHSRSLIGKVNESGVYALARIAAGGERR